MKKVKIRIVGIGIEAKKIIKALFSKLKGVSFYHLVAGRARSAPPKSKIKTIALEALSNLGEKALIKKEKGRIAEIFKGQDFLIFFSFLGGTFSNYVFENLSEWFSSCEIISPKAKFPPRGISQGKNLSLGIFSLPFKFESNKKIKIAKKSLEKIKKNLSGVNVIFSSKVFRIIDKKTPLKKAMALLDKNIVSTICELIELIGEGGDKKRQAPINIDFNSLKSILEGKGQSVFLGSAFSTAGKVNNLVKKIFQGENITSFNFKNILYSVIGPRNLPMLEVSRIGNEIYRLFPKAKIIFGTHFRMPSQKTGYNNKIKLLFLGIVGGQKGKKTGEKTEKKSKIKKIKKEKSVPPAEGRRTVSRRRKIRRSGLDIKKEEKKEELSQIEEEKEWEIPAFLRK